LRKRTRQADTRTARCCSCCRNTIMIKVWQTVKDLRKGKRNLVLSKLDLVRLFQVWSDWVRSDQFGLDRSGWAGLGQVGSCWVRWSWVRSSYVIFVRLGYFCKVRLDKAKIGGANQGKALHGLFLYAFQWLLITLNCNFSIFLVLRFAWKLL
jgi:hypothetical protein